MLSNILYDEMSAYTSHSNFDAYVNQSEHREDMDGFQPKDLTELATHRRVSLVWSLASFSQKLCQNWVIR